MDKMIKIILIVIVSLIFLSKNISAKEAGTVVEKSTLIVEELLYDKGSDKIDVSKYPRVMQEAYKVFASKCSKCHTLARPINSPYAIPEEWERYIKMMMRKPGSGIDPKSAKTIYEFLKYDSQVRKKGLYERKLKERKK
ncbi:MAG: photosystem P840 reaction-center cytochrome c-551 [Nitrospinae bacterium]|nr:photosystem P840 reaction-center cytochrome c-551 [Nitrospinota bacterium]